VSNRNNSVHNPAEGKTHITLANGANLVVDQTPDETAELIAAGKLGNDAFVKFTVLGNPTYLSKSALELVLMVYVPPVEMAIAKGDPAQYPALRR
jgi:hypothetical protein